MFYIEFTENNRDIHVRIKCDFIPSKCDCETTPWSLLSSIINSQTQAHHHFTQILIFFMPSLAIDSYLSNISPTGKARQISLIDTGLVGPNKTQPTRISNITALTPYC